MVATVDPRSVTGDDQWPQDQLLSGGLLHLSELVRLENLQPGVLVHGVSAGGPVTVVAVRWHGTTALTLTYRDSSGHTDEQLLYRADEPSLMISAGKKWTFAGDGHLFRLVSEA